MTLRRTSARLGLAALAVACCGVAGAQEGTAAAAPTMPDSTASTTQPSKPWPRKNGLPHGGKILIITVADPGTRLPCKVVELDQDHIACSQHFSKRTTLTRSQVKTLIEPAHAGSSMRTLTLVQGAFGGGILAGGVFLLGVSTGGGVTLIVVGGLVLLDGLKFLNSSNPPTPERVLYEQP